MHHFLFFIKQTLSSLLSLKPTCAVSPNTFGTLNYLSTKCFEAANLMSNVSERPLILN